MNWLSPAALVLLAAVPVLLWLALRRQRPRSMQVGTLLIWRRAVQATASATRTKRRIEPLLWLLLAASALGAVGAARPALAPSTATPEVAVYVERLAESGSEPDLAGLIDRAREVAPESRLRIWFGGEPGDLAESDTINRINPGPVGAELAQFFAASRDMPCVMFLCEPETGAAGMGLVLPRVTQPRDGVIFELRSEEDSLHVRMSQGNAPKVEGATLGGAETRGREYTRTYTANGETVRMSTATQSITLNRKQVGVGVGPDWSSLRHTALLAALRPGSGATPEVWLGGAESLPAVRINQGKAASLDGAEIAFDSQHALFRELPLSSVDFTKSARLIERSPGVRPLASATRGGEIAGDLVTLSADGKVLAFAGDPFTDSGVAAAALMLDNAIGVITGQRPSERPQYQLVEGVLPTRRQAMAEPFDPRGEIGAGRRAPEPDEYAPWLLALAGLCALGASARAIGSGSFSGRKKAAFASTTPTAGESA